MRYTKLELTSGKELIICPIRHMYRELEKNPPHGKTVAIIVSMSTTVHPSLRLLDARHSRRKIIRTRLKL